MPAHRIPTEIKKLKGSFHCDPTRKLEPRSEQPLGSAPATLDKQEQAIWREIKSISCEGVMFESDRLVVETLCRIVAKFRRREDLSPSEWTRFSTALSQLGMTPADRTRIQVKNLKKEDDPFADFVVESEQRMKVVK